MENNTQQIAVTPLSLPKGGGAITGMGETLGTIGPDGIASLTLPLPLSTGRGYSPSLALSYSSGAGNSPYGLGWGIGNLTIRRRTTLSAPHYNEQDEFLFGNERLIPALTAAGEIKQRKIQQDQRRYTITTYLLAITGSFDRIEHWQLLNSSFWLVQSTDGQRHCLGKSPHAQIVDPQQPTHIAEWLLEESLSTTGEHICYYYQSEDDAGTDVDEQRNHSQACAQRYLQRVCYGNISPHSELYSFSQHPTQSAWLFTLVFDYGERSHRLSDMPTFDINTPWSLRQDPFSHYEYGFEVRTRRLCHQILMFHNMRALSGDSSDEMPELVRCMRLNYIHSPCASQLANCQRVAYEENGTPLSLPPLEFDYQELAPLMPTGWQPMDELLNFNVQQRYQLVDLNGDGIAGVLYQERGNWRYHPPIRQEGTRDGVVYGPAISLPQLPSLNDSAQLMDINGDGRLDWVITQPGLAGYYRHSRNGDWTHFTPIAALPTEYFHPQAMLADLIGSGLSDLVLIGPKSVRLYTNQREQFSPAELVYQAEGINLPIPGADSNQLVAFADLLGSGQQHLVKICHDGVTCWPNMGLGNFGQPISLNGFSQPQITFDPQRIYLADLDGSGTVDIIYAESQQLLIYFNQSGNRFAAPIILPLPAGSRYDHTCQLTLADIQGLGVASFVLTTPHMRVKHWRYNLSTEKPYLLSTINNNMGAEHQWRYRSSVQFWLDEKAADSHTSLISQLPFPIHLLSETTQLDEINGNRLAQSAAYYHGFYDAKNREFRGFGRVDTLDTHHSALGTAAERSAPTLVRSWFHTGRPANETLYQHEYWAGDKLAFDISTNRLTEFDDIELQDKEIAPHSDEQHYWLHRALKGTLLRSEIYGQDSSPQAALPYSVNTARYQVRRVQPSHQSYPLVAMPLLLEQLSYQYERIPQDPQCSQQIILQYDAFGYPLHSASINYPRRQSRTVTPYSWLATGDTPDQASQHWSSSYDEQQMLLRITESWQSYYHLTQDEQWRLGLPWQQRNDIVTDMHPPIDPQKGLNYEILCLPSGPLSNRGKAERIFAGQQEIFYHSAYLQQGLVAYSEIAEFDDTNLEALNQLFSSRQVDISSLKPGDRNYNSMINNRNKRMKQAGYQQVPLLFANENLFADTHSRRPQQAGVWVARRGFTQYAGADGFYRPIQQRTSALVGETTLFWDKNFCVVNKIRLADGSQSEAKYNYRLMAPYQLKDVNDNIHWTEFDALGRVTSLRFWGTEYDEVAQKAAPVGYSQPSDKPFKRPNSVDEAIADSALLPVARYWLYQPFSWMCRAITLQFSMESTESLIQTNVMIEEGYFCTIGLRRWLRQHQPTLPSLVTKLLNNPIRHPPHIMAVVTDRYDSDPEQQQQQSIALSDGFGRTLQSASRVEEGQAYHVDENNYHLTSKLVNTRTRWAVSGRTEYDNKGLVIRSYQPLFLDNWHYVTNDSARKNTFADTHIYDPLGREITVITAKGYQRRAQYFPWFVISEDENDTAVDSNSH